MVFDVKQTLSNIPQSSTSSCTEFISEIKCGSNRCPKCCISSAINDHTYEVLKKICKKIIKDINRKQCRENYSVFDGGNSVKVRIQRGQNMEADKLAATKKNMPGMPDSNYMGAKGRQVDELGRNRERARSKSSKRGAENGDDDAYGDKAKSGKVGSTKSKKNIDADEEDYDPRSKKTKDRKSSKQLDDYENELKANKSKAKGKAKSDEDVDEIGRSKKGKSKGDEDYDEAERGKKGKKKGKKGLDDEDVDEIGRSKKRKSKGDEDEAERDKKGKKKGKKGLDDDSETDLKKNKSKPKSKKSKDGDEDDYEDTERTKKGKAKGKAKGKNLKALDDDDSEADLKRKKTKLKKSKGNRRSGDDDDGNDTDPQKRNLKGKKTPKGKGRNEDEDDLPAGKGKPKRKSKSDMPIITDLRSKVRKGEEVRPQGKQGRTGGKDPRREKDRLMSLDKELSKLKKKQKTAKQLLTEQQENARGRKTPGRGKSSSRSGRIRSQRSSSRQYGSRSVHGLVSEARISTKQSRGDQARPCDFLRANMEQRDLCRLCDQINANNRAPCSDPCNTRGRARNVCSEVIQSCYYPRNTCF